MQDWALDRECELSRLEFENQELRRMLGLLPPPSPPPLPARPALSHQPDHPNISPSAIPLRWDINDQRLGSHPLDSDPSDSVMLRRHPQTLSPPQSTPDLPSQFVQSHSSPFSSDTPLVTRKYSRRGVNGANGIFGTGSFIPGAGVESTPTSAMGSTFRTPWLDPERTANPLGSIHAQTVNMADNRGATWDGLSNIYSNKPWAQSS